MNSVESSVNPETDSKSGSATTPPPAQPAQRGCFQPFCLALMLLILVTVLVLGGTVVLIVRQVIPPDLVTNVVSAITGRDAPIVVKATSVLDRIQGMSQLTSTRYNYSSLVTSQRDMPDALSTLYGDKEVLIAVGYVTAGIDLKQLKPEDITQSGDTLTIRLPPAQLHECFLDEQKSYVASRDTGIFAKPAPNLDEQARRYAVQQFRDMALNSDILTNAGTGAQSLIQAFVSDLGVQGIKTVTVVTSDPDKTTLPSSCQ